MRDMGYPQVPKQGQHELMHSAGVCTLTEVDKVKLLSWKVKVVWKEGICQRWSPYELIRLSPASSYLVINTRVGGKGEKSLVLSPEVWYKWSVKKELQEYVGMRECLQVLLRELIKHKDKEGKSQHLLGRWGKNQPAPVAPAGRVHGEHNWVKWEIFKTGIFLLLGGWIVVWLYRSTCPLFSHDMVTMFTWQYWCWWAEGVQRFYKHKALPNAKLPGRWASRYKGNGSDMRHNCPFVQKAFDFSR